MKWIHGDQLKAITDHSYAYPGKDDCGLQLLLQRGESVYLLRKSADPSAAALLLEIDDLASDRSLKILMRLFPLHKGQLARWLGQFAEASPQAALNALGQSLNYKNLEEWQGWAKLAEDCLQLAVDFDPPFPILRLWERLPELERNRWSNLFRKRSIRRNLVRDLMLDLVELDEARRQEAWQSAEAEDRGFSGKSQSFPAELIRDTVRSLRRPAYSALKSEVYRLKRALGLPRGVQLEIPEDLEDLRLELRIEFESVAELSGRLAAANRNKFLDGLSALLLRLRE
ncbi:MAG: hypothetical protein K1X75_08910 [Leptospirales bacterium]|nr:hypothetical protein [Leptospirales bacterium]